MLGRSEAPDWARYLDEFHQQRPGVVGSVLRRCRADDLTPHHWLVRPIAFGAERVLDLACGSGLPACELAEDAPRCRSGPPPAVVGVDQSASELKLAAANCQSAVQADARQLPFADGSFDAVSCSMGFAVIRPLEQALAEAARVVKPRGLLTATLAGPVPLRPSDLSVLGQLTARLRSTPRFPERRDLARLGSMLAEAGFTQLEDARERFVYTVRDLDDAELLLDALYLPTTSNRRRFDAARWLADKAAGSSSGVDIAIPIRRVVALRQ